MTVLDPFFFFFFNSFDHLIKNFFFFLTCYLFGWLQTTRVSGKCFTRATAFVVASRCPSAHGAVNAQPRQRSVIISMYVSNLFIFIMLLLLCYLLFILFTSVSIFKKSNYESDSTGLCKLFNTFRFQRESFAET